MSTTQVYLPLDLTGSSPDNLVPNEYQKIVGGARSIIRPNYGAFYKTGFHIYTVSGSNQLGLLYYGSDYVFADFDDEASAASGKEVYKNVIILNKNLTSIFAVTYQAYGGIENINRPLLNSLAEQAGLGTSTPWSLLTDVPATFAPSSHKHDIKDVYGAEVFSKYLLDLNSAIVASQYKAKNIPVTAAIKKFSQTQEALTNALAIDIRRHIDGLTNQHNYTAAMIGLPDIQNYGFSTSVTIVNGQVVKTYGGPDTIAYYLANRPGYTSTNHAFLRSNPHNDTAADYGLGSVVNLAMIANYTPGTQQYSSLLNVNATQVYMAPYPLVEAINEMAQVEFGTSFQALLTSVVNSAQATVNNAQSVLTSTATEQASLNDKVSQLVSGQTTVSTAAEQSAAAGSKYDLLYGNATYSATLTQVQQFEHSAYLANGGTTTDGYFPVPENLEGLVLWLDPNYTGNTYFQDLNGRNRVVNLVDRSGNGHTFTAEQPATAPELAMSYDQANNLIGISNSKVMHFRDGYSLQKTAGDKLSIKPGMTIIAVVKTGKAMSRLSILNDINNPLNTGIYAFGTNNQILSVLTGDSWKPLVAPDNSTSPYTSAIVIGSISPVGASYCWIGASVARLNGYPKGTNIPANTWPNNYVGESLNQIGINNFGINNEGEIGDVLIYNRQLSMAECQALVSYLMMRYSNNQALAVDFSALNSF